MKNIKKLALCLFLVLSIGLLARPFSARAAGKPDMAEKGMSAWARAGVVAAYDSGMVDRSFDLGADYSLTITRLQLARLAVDFIAEEKDMTTLKLAGTVGLFTPTSTPEEPQPKETELPELHSGSFTDTKSAYAELASKLGIMKGDGGLFRPNDPVPRAEAAAVLQRSMSALGVTEANRAPGSFSDTYLIPRWAVEAVKFASGRTDAGGTALMGGASDSFSPRGRLTIEQAIITLLRMHDSKTVKDVYPGWRDAPGYNRVQLALTFGGDCTFGRGLDFGYEGSFDEMYEQMGPDYFFSGIEEFHNDDMTMVNFEGTLTEATSYADKTFVFKGRPDYAKILPAGSIDVVTVANNHSMDYLEQGFEDTLNNLSPYVAVSGYERMPIVTVKGVKIGFASNVGWDFDEAQESFIRSAIQTLRAAGADLVVFNFHWGIEGTYHSDDTQEAIARYCIDQGADLVIGHHPHVAQETETYKGKHIAYSLGNLVFGGNKNPGDKSCLIFRQDYLFDLDTHTVISDTYAAIPYLVSSVPWRNDYHPVRAGY